MIDNIYSKPPIEIVNGIPCFCKKDNYVRNYDTIAKELVENIKKTGKNPWMDEELWRESERDTFSICEKYIKDGDSVLDIGCGTGRMLSYFDNVTKYGIDISIDMATMSAEKGIISCMGNVENLPYTDNSMDMIICTDVLEHVFDLYRTLLEINRVIKPDGYIILRVPQNEEMSPYLDPNYPFEYVHLRMFSESSLRLYCTKVFDMEYLESKNSYEVFEGYAYKNFAWIPDKITEIIRGWAYYVLSREKFLSKFTMPKKHFVEIIEAFKSSKL